jgi:hypothetical protein
MYKIKIAVLIPTIAVAIVILGSTALSYSAAYAQNITTTASIKKSSYKLGLFSFMGHSYFFCHC